MALVPDPIIDTQLAACEGTQCHVCSGQPADYAGIAAVQLATAVIAGSYALADGTPDGRKNTLPGQADMDIDSSGTATHYAISNGTSILYVVADISNPQALTAGGTVSVAALAQTVRDAT